MVITMTNRLLALVIAVALSGGIAAHAAQSPHQPMAPITLTSATSLPVVLQTAASHLTETATGTIDPSAAIRSAYQRDHVALEHLRQQASALKGSAHPAFNQYISDQEAALTELERTAMATIRPSAGGSIAAMDQLVSAAQATLNRELAQPAAMKTNGSTGSAKSNQGQGSTKK
ncbi:MAG: hypothetical protein E6I88_13260 [Chloroflexi bacterium]|nr:MAG: hypothetical protein E6I88_13260 [Chloroflexota bacterium]